MLNSSRVFFFFLWQVSTFPIKVTVILISESVAVTLVLKQLGYVYLCLSNLRPPHVGFSFGVSTVARLAPDCARDRVSVNSSVAC